MQIKLGLRALGGEALERQGHGVSLATRRANFSKLTRVSLWCGCFSGHSPSPRLASSSDLALQVLASVTYRLF